MPTKKRKRQTIEDDIRKAAERIPTLIAAEQLRESAQPRSLSHQSKRRFLWAGVGCTMLIIFGMWYLNAKNFFLQLKNTPDNDPGVFQNATKDFEALLNQAALQDDVLRRVEEAQYDSQKDREERIARALEEEFSASLKEQATTTSL